MSNQYAIKSWLYALGVTVAMLFLLALNTSGQAGQDDDELGAGNYNAASNMQLARGDHAVTMSQRRTQAVTDVTNDVKTQQLKQETKGQPGVQGPAGKIPGEVGPVGKDTFHHSDNLSLPGDGADGCSKFLRCSGD